MTFAEGPYITFSLDFAYRWINYVPVPAATPPKMQRTAVDVGFINHW